MINRQANTYVSKIIINRPYDVVWSMLSNPLNYAELYPNWIKTIKKTGENNYLVEDQFDESYPITVVLNKEFGVIDLHIGKETSHLRLFKLSANSTATVHLAKQWEGIGWLSWFFHKITTDRDLKNARFKIEANQ